MPLEDADLQNHILNVLNDNTNLKIDGSQHLHAVCKELADSIFRDWAEKTDGAPMKAKWHPIVIASMHKSEVPSANQGEHYHKYIGSKTSPETDMWRAYTFKVENLFIIIKFGVQWGKHAERACQSHFNDFQSLADCIGINQSDKLRCEPKKQNKDCVIF